jgi:hypothetical protein
VWSKRPTAGALEQAHVFRPNIITTELGLKDFSGATFSHVKSRQQDHYVPYGTRQGACRGTHAGGASWSTLAFPGGFSNRAAEMNLRTNAPGTDTSRVEGRFASHSIALAKYSRGYSRRSSGSPGALK